MCGAKPDVRVMVCLLGLAAAMGCGAHRPSPVTPSRAGARPSAQMPPAQAAHAIPLYTIEATDPALRNALDHANLEPGVDAFQAVAVEYRRLQVYDKAIQFLDRALTLRPNDPASLDARARLWRDAGFPNYGLSDAYRAIHFAPRSAIPRNTLGTLLQALGQRAQARAEFERAVALDPTAAYALSNLCYAWLVDGRAAQAVDACARAVQVDPSLTAARNNLALAHASLGNVDAARGALAAADRATELYNTGILHMALRQYRSATEAFAAAHTLRPSMTQALARARQAAQLAERGEE